MWGVSLDGSPRGVLLWGIGFGVLGAALIIFLPFIPSSVWFPIDIAEQSKTLGLGVEIVLRIVRQIAPSLGSALIAAAIVMGYAKTLPRSNSN
jgi:hypothetical protein